ncbi:unnamed protein product [Caenorhabditis sp. 36 PRJEB53466]|nr:unnamed protein product [Caenorhabditis sp. 36 PRJEB53466]
MSEHEGKSLEKSSSNRTVPSALSNAKSVRKTENVANIVPFNACLFTVLTVSGSLQLTALFPNFGSFLSLLISFFTYEWFNLHFPSMTRSRRACFDIANVLETYQPRARTHGHLFVPDPPTPCVKIAEEGNEHDMPKEKNSFTNARDSHYENMYQKAIQMAKEMDQMEKVAASPNMDGAQNAELKPANPEKDRKESEEKSKKAKAKYDADMAKPFSC